MDTIWCSACARTNKYGIWDGLIHVHWFPEYDKYAPREVLEFNFMQVYSNRARLDEAGVTKLGIRQDEECPDNQG